MKKLTYLSWEKSKSMLVEIGAKVSYRGVNEVIVGIVQKVSKGKALVQALYRNSYISQWIDVEFLTVLPA